MSELKVMEAKSLRQSRRGVHFLSVTWGAGFCKTSKSSTLLPGEGLVRFMALQTREG